MGTSGTPELSDVRSITKEPDSDRCQALIINHELSNSNLPNLMNTRNSYIGRGRKYGVNWEGIYNGLLLTALVLAAVACLLAGAMKS